MKLNILISLVFMACTFTLTACSATQKSEVSTKNPITEDESTSTEEAATGIHSSDCYEAVDSTLSDLCKSDEFINATDDEKAELAWSTLEELEAKGLIMQGSITYNAPNNSSISFKYTNGASGVFVLKEFDERLN